MINANSNINYHTSSIIRKNRDELAKLKLPASTANLIISTLSDNTALSLDIPNNDFRRMESDHDFILNIIEAIGGLTDPNYKRVGYCFGTTVTILYALMADIIYECKISIKRIKKEFKDLNTDESIKNHFSTLENDRVVSAIIPSIAIAHDPPYHRGVFLENKDYFTSQETSLSGLFDFFKQGAPAGSPVNHAVWLDGFAFICTFEKLGKMINAMGSIDSSHPIGFYISYRGHAFGFGYDPRSAEWVLTNTSNHELLLCATTAGITYHAWDAIKDSRNYRAIYIKPVVIKHSQKKYEDIMDKFKDAAMNEIDHYDNDILQSLYSAADHDTCTHTLNRLIKNGLIKSEHSFIQNMEALTDDKSNLFLSTITSKKFDVTKALVLHAPADFINSRLQNGDTPLITAIKHQKDLIADAICQNQHIDVHIVDHNGVSALQHALQKGYFDLAIKIVKKLRWYSPSIINAEIDFTNKYTPLHLAAMQNQFELAEALLKKGADVNARTGNGWRPIHLAAMRNNVNILKLLCRHEEIERIEPFMLLNAMREKCWRTAAKILSTSPVNLLLNIINLKDYTSQNETLLHLAVKCGEVEIVKLLLKNGADPNLSDSTGRTPLHIALHHQYTEIVAVLRTSATHSMVINSSTGNKYNNNVEHVSKKARIT